MDGPNLCRRRAEYQCRASADGSQKATIIHGLANVAWSGTKHPEEAKALVKFLGSEEAALIWRSPARLSPRMKGCSRRGSSRCPI